MGYINGCAKVGIFREMPSGEELPMIVADCNCNGTAHTNCISATTPWV